MNTGGLEKGEGVQIVVLKVVPKKEKKEKDEEENEEKMKRKMKKKKKKKIMGLKMEETKYRRRKVKKNN